MFVRCLAFTGFLACFVHHCDLFQGADRTCLASACKEEAQPCKGLPQEGCISGYWTWEKEEDFSGGAYSGAPSFLEYQGASASYSHHIRNQGHDVVLSILRDSEQSDIRKMSTLQCSLERSVDGTQEEEQKSQQVSKTKQSCSV